MESSLLSEFMTGLGVATVFAIMPWGARAIIYAWQAAISVD
jgi:hypothetical protein